MMYSQSLPVGTDSLTERVLAYKPLIVAALHHSDDASSFDHVMRGILNGDLHFYPLDGAFVIMELMRYGNWSSYHCYLAGGKLESILSIQETMLINAKQLGCKKITLNGRKGFTKVLPAHGWRHVLSVMELPVSL